MGLSGKYNFEGIKKFGAASVRSAFPYPFFQTKLGQTLLEFLSNYLANSGLVILNIGYNAFDGEFDQHRFDKSMSTAIDEIEKAGGVDKLSPKRIKELDDEVIKAARKFIVIGRP